MLDPQIGLQINSGSSYRELLWCSYVTILSLVGIYLLVDFFRVAGLNAKSVTRKLAGIRAALEALDFGLAARLASKIPEGSPEDGLRHLLGNEDPPDPAKIHDNLWRAEMAFRRREHALRSRISSLRALFFVTLLSCVALFFATLRSTLAGLATERVHGLETLSESISVFAGMALDTFILLTALYLVTEYCSLALARRLADWDSFSFHLSELLR